MGTKIEYSINLLATLVDSNNLAVGGVDVWEHYQNKGRLSNNRYRTGIINKLQDPMDRMLDRNNIESIKKTMQMHEDIFKYQVRELHRVYSVQKMLTDELKNEIRQQKFWNPINDTKTSHIYSVEQQHHTTKMSNRPDFNVESWREDLGSRERSGTCSRDTIKRQRSFDLENAAEAGPSSSYAAFQSCKTSTCCGGSNEEMEVDLTLGIGCSHSPNGKSRELNSRASLKSDRVGECSDSTTPMNSSTVTFTQETKGPHWLSQGLQLK